MKVDRAEWVGTGAALAIHAALIAALSMSLARTRLPEPPTMEVEFVEDTGLTAAAPNPPAASQAPEIGEAPPDQPAPAPAAEPLPPPPPSEVTPPPPPTPAPSPITRPKAQPRPAPQRPAPVARPSPPRAAPATPARTARPAPAKAAPRASRIGDDFLKGIGDAPASPAKPTASAPRLDANAMAGIQQAIRRRVQPCADRQVNPGPGASRIRVKLHLQLGRSGQLLRPPQVVSVSGVDDDNGQYEERVKDLAVAAFVGCAPLTGLPPALYQTAQGGWSNFNMNYNLP